MKVSLFDFVSSALVMLLLWATSAIVSIFFLAPLVSPWAGIYSSIIVVGILFTLYGILSGMTIQILIKLRPLKEGEFDFESSEFTYFKLLTMIHYFGMKTLFLFNIAPFVPLLNVLFGAKVGKNVAIGGLIDNPYLVSVGDGVVLGSGSMVSGNIIQSGKLIIKRVSIANNVTIGVYSMVMPGCEMGEGSSLGPHSTLIVGSKVPAGEIWKGNPARTWS